MTLSCLAGCNLVTLDSERDMNQVVATIPISEDAPEETIYKKDMVMAYLNYGYMYEQYYGYTRAQTFKLIIDNLVNNRVYVQNAIVKFSEGSSVSADEKWNAKNYISESDVKDADYQTYLDINNLIDSYELDSDQEDLGDTFVGTVIFATLFSCVSGLLQTTGEFSV